MSLRCVFIYVAFSFSVFRFFLCIIMNEDKYISDCHDCAVDATADGEIHHLLDAASKSSVKPAVVKSDVNYVSFSVRLKVGVGTSLFLLYL